jgi:hypothetical protein
MAFGRRTETAAPAPAAPAIEFEERKAPELFKFENEGATVEGRLLYVEEREIADDKTGEIKSVPVYGVQKFDGAFRQSNGDVLEFMQSADLRKKLTSGDVNRFIRVRFTGVQQVRNGKMRVFEVQVQKKAQQQDRTQITDEDVPF